MAKGQFEKGNKFGKGRPPLDSDTRSAIKLTRTEIEILFTKFVSMPLPELKAKVDRREGTVLELMIMRVIERSIATGDQIRLNFLLDRLVGKVPQPVESGEQGFIIKVEEYKKG